MSRDPLLVILEFVRAEQASDEFVSPHAPQEYHRHLDGGGVKVSTLMWGEALFDALEGLRSPRRAASSAQELGHRLRDFLDPMGWSAEEAEISLAVREGRRVFITIRSSAAELYMLPWELVTFEDSTQAIGEVDGVLIRYEWPGTETEAAAGEPSSSASGRILFAWSAAGGGLPAAAHEEAIRLACGEGSWAFDPARDVLRSASLRSLERALSAPTSEPVTMLHLLCHGAAEGGSFGVSLDGEGESGAALVDAAKIGTLLKRYAGTLRAVVLAACDSSNMGDPGNHLGSIAQAIHRAGIQAVIGSRLPISVPSSITLAQALYRKLLCGPSSLEEAFIEARRELARQPGKLDWAALQLYAREADRGDTRPLVMAPYRGLLAFQTKHSMFFLGRDAERRQLRVRVARAVAGELPRLQIVAGASGSGKSSLVSAGVVSELLKEEGPCWDVIMRRPADKAGLAGIVSSMRRRREGLPPESLVPSTNASERPETRRPATPSAADVLAEARALRAENPDRRLLLVIDQLEEIFTLGWGSGVREHAAQVLWDLSRDEACGVIVLCTIRIDFLGRCGEIVVNDEGQRLRLDKVVYDPSHTCFVPQLAADKLSEIIRGPAERAGLELEPGLVDSICADVGEETTALPLLQHALHELWMKRSGSKLTKAAYQAMGSFKGALTRAADGVIEKMSPAERAQARRLLVRMVNPAEVGGSDTRRRGWTDLIQPDDPEAAEAFNRALGKLVKSRLVVAGDDTPEDPGSGAWAELAHDALIRSWETLRGWVAEDRAVLAKVEAIRRACDEWTAHLGAPRSDDYLLGGEPLATALDLVKYHRSELEPDLLGFIEASRRSEQAEIDARLARQAKRDRRAIISAVAIAALIIGCGVLTAVAVRSYEKRNMEADRAAKEKRLAVNSMRLSIGSGHARTEPTRAAALLREVEEPDQTPGWLQVAIDVASQEIAPVVLQGHDEPLSSIEWSPDGSRLVTASEDGTAGLWEAGGAVGPVSLRHEGPVVSARFSAGGDRVVTASKDKTARVFRLDSPSAPVILPHNDPVSSAAFSRDGERVLTLSAGRARVFHADGVGRPILLRHEAHVSSAAWSARGDRIVTASQDGRVTVWDPDRGEALVTLPAAAALTSASFSPDGESIAVVTLGSTVRVWSAREARLLASIENGDPVRAAVWSPDGSAISVTSRGGPTRVHRADGLFRVVLEHEDAAISVAWSPDGRRVATGAQDGSIRVFALPSLAFSVDTPELRERKPELILRHPRAVQSIAWSPAGDRVATASTDGLGRVWSARSTAASMTLRSSGGVHAARMSPDRSAVAVISGGTESLGAVFYLNQPRDKDPIEPLALWRREGEGPGSIAWSPDSKRVLAAPGGRDARVYRLDRPGEPTILRHEERVRAASFDRDGARVVTASDDHTASLWTEGVDEPLDTFRHDGPVLTAAWSPDGERVVTGSKDGTARIWSAKKAFQPIVLEHDSAVQHVAWSPDGELVATVSAGEIVRVWPTAGGPPYVSPKGRCGAADMVWWSHDGGRLLLRSVRNVACIMSHDFKSKPIFLEHAEAVKWAAWAPDDARVVTACADDRAHLFLADTGAEIAALPEHGDDVLSAAWSLDGRSVLIGSADGAARVTPVDAGELSTLLWRATSFCVVPDARVRLFGLDGLGAVEGYQACVRRHNESLTGALAAPSYAPSAEPR